MMTAMMTAMMPACRCVAIAAAFLACVAWPGGAQQIRSSELPPAALGGAYNTQIQTLADVRCPQADVSVALESGVLPRGLELSGDRLQGRALEMGAFPLRIRAANGCRSTAKDFILLVTGKPILGVVPEELVIEYRVGQPAPAPLSILVSSTWPRLAYNVTSETAEWLKVSVSEGITPDRGSAFAGDSVWVRVQPQKLAPGIYKSTLTFDVWHAANAPVVPVTLKVVP